MRIADEMQVDCPVFYVDNVAEYSNALASKGGSWGPSDLPNIVPPFDRAWIEYRTPAFQVAWLLDSVAVDAQPMNLSKPVHKMVRGVLYIRVEKATVCVGEEFIGVGHDGQLVGMHVKDVWKIPPVALLRGSLVAMWGHPMLLAISFMHCKNVRHVEKVPKVDEKFLRATGKKPRVRYYTLEIYPMREVLRRDGNVEANGLAKALHICRGHFATYTADKPLFGRVVGTVWRDAHVRGKAEHGVVVKDYAVKAPTDGTVH